MINSVNLVGLRQILSDLVRLGRIWSDLVGFGQIRLDSVRFCPIWSDFGRIWSDSVGSGRIGRTQSTVGSGQTQSTARSGRIQSDSVGVAPGRGPIIIPELRIDIFPFRFSVQIPIEISSLYHGAFLCHRSSEIFAEIGKIFFESIRIEKRYDFN